jgi:hypothetical protein
MSWWKHFRHLWLISIATLVFTLPAFAQFEVSPDHFDSDGQNQNLPSVSKKAGLAPSSSSPASKPRALSRGPSQEATLAASPRPPVWGVLETSTGAKADHKVVARRRRNHARQLARARPSVHQAE